MTIVKIISGWISTTLTNPTEDQLKQAMELIKKNDDRKSIEVFRYKI